MSDPSTAVPHDDLASQVGITPDLMNRLAYQWRSHEESLDLFAQWYEHVIEPIGLPVKPAWEMFIGKTSMVDYVTSMSDEQADRFADLFPELQEAHQTRIDNGEVF